MIGKTGGGNVVEYVNEIQITVLVHTNKRKYKEVVLASTIFNATTQVNELLESIDAEVKA